MKLRVVHVIVLLSGSLLPVVARCPAQDVFGEAGGAFGNNMLKKNAIQSCEIFAQRKVFGTLYH